MKRLFTFTVMILVVNFLQGQPLTGVKTIPGDYATISSAIAMLNSQGTAAPGVTFNVASGYVENSVGSIILNTTTSSAAAPIVFQKLPGGAVNPKIFFNTGIWNNAFDGGILIAGSDYVTFNAIDIFSSDNTIDLGYGLFKRNNTAPFDGCQYVTIKNCNISLTNNSYSYGIYCGNQVTGNSTALTITTTSDACNNCKFYGNTISNVSTGISINGYNAPSPYTLYDQGNEIGVSGANTITNFGGGYTAAGIIASYQNAISISGNNISSGSYTNTPVYNLYGISLTGGTQAGGTISNNIISLSILQAGYQGMCGIYTTFGNSGTTNILNITGNTIQNCSYPNATSANFYGIVNTVTNNGPGTINITGNSIHDITIGGYGSFYGIDAGTAVNVNISNNTLFNFSATGSDYLYAIRSWTGNTTLHDNVVHDLAVSNGTNPLYGFFNTASPTVENYYNNTFYNFNHSGNGPVYGMMLNTTGGTRQTYSNTIYSLSSAGGTVYGMFHQSSTPNIYRNNVYDLTSTTAAGQVYGIYVYTGNNAVVYNNYISDLKAPASTGTNAVCGIYIYVPSPVSLLYNTIYLNASSSSTTTFGTSGIYANTNFTVEMKNNVVVNNSMPVFTTAPAYTVAYQRSAVSLPTYATTSNNNCFYAGTPGPNNLIYFDGTNSDQSISLYKARMTPRETASFSEIPPFADAANHNLHLLPAVPTMIESAGTRITTPVAITDDFDGDIRWGETGYAGSGTAPDAGADEGNFTPKPAMGYQSCTTDQVTGNVFSGTTNQAIIRMKITVNGGSSPLNVTQFTLNSAGTTAITDINAAPSKIWYTGNSSFWGSGLLFGTATPTIANYSVSGSQVLTPGDNYFWLVYDVIQTAQTGHIIDGQCLNVTIGGVSQVPTVTSPGGNMMILGPMSGTYLVGAGNSFPNFVTLTDAVNNINHRGNLGPVIFSLTNPSSIPYNSANGEVFPITVGVIPFASATNTTTLQPAAGVSPVITGVCLQSNSVLKLNGTDYFILNGSNSGTTSRDLTIENTSTANWTAALQISSPGSLSGATYCTVKNCIIRGGSPGSQSMYTYAFSAGSSIGNTGDDNDNLTIDNNEFSRAFFAVYIAAGTSGPLDNLVFTNNTVGSDDPTCYIGNTGVTLNNTIGLFSNNVIKGVISSTVATWGLYIGPGVKNSLFTKNDIHAIRCPGNSNGGTGIVVDLRSAGGNVTVANNVIYDITGVGSANLDSYGTAGMKIDGYTTNLKVYYNTVCLSGFIDRSAATGDLSAALFVSSLASQLDIRNNIFSNSLENTTGDSKAYAVYIPGNAAAYTALDYNDYRPGGREGVLGYFSGADKLTISAWQTSTGKDANSLSVNPDFNSPAVLIPYPGSPVLDKCPALAITDDYNGTARTAPTSMGAYETGNDVTPPVVTYTPLYNTHLLTARTLTATITDYYSTVPTSGVGLPRLYWKINNNPYTAVTGVWTSGNTYQFTFGNFVAPGDLVNYFIVSQDNMAVPNVGAYPSLGASGFSANPPACTIPAITAHAYGIVGGISGVINIPGDYATLTGDNGFFNVMNQKVMTGNITVKIAGNLNEPGTWALNEINTESPLYKLSIVNSGAYHTISGSYNGALIKFNGIDNLTINGKGKLLISNTNANPSVGLEMIGSCNNNIIDSCSFSTGYMVWNPANYGIYISGPSSNNLIRRDSIFRTNTGIYLNATYWGLGSGNVITGNYIGSTTSANYVGNNGIIAQYEDNLTISKNLVYNIIGNNSPIGIYTEAITNSIIEKNDVRDVVYNGTSYGGASGITLKSLSTSPNVMIRNNAIRHIAGMGSSPNTGDNNTIPAGIKLFGSATSGINIYNNSVYMPRDLSYGLFYNNEWFTAMEIGAGISGIVMKNNILQNSVGEWPNSNLTSWGYAVYCKVLTSPFSSVNNNLYFTSNFDNNYVGLDGTAVPPVNNMLLPAWQTFTGQDGQSQNVDPLFTSATNLIPLPASTAIGGGLPCPGIVDDDILGNARGTSTTIGAYEMVSAATKTLNISVFLQGLSSGSGTMNPAWDNAGPHWGVAVADHISIELHDATPGNYASVIYTASDVVLSTTGQASAYIPGGFSGTYYVTIRHRNGLPTVSATPLSFSGVSISYSFDAPAKAYGNKLVSLPAGGYGIYGGDVNQDGAINGSDKTIVNAFSGSFTTGYQYADINGDGTVDSADMTVVDNNAAAGISSSTP